MAPGADTKLAVAVQPPTVDVVAALRASPFVDVVGDARQADLELHRQDEGWVLADDLHGLDHTGPRFPVVPLGDPDLLRLVTEHYYRYRAPLRMAHASRDLPTLLRLSLLGCDNGPLPAETAQTAALHEVAGTDRARYEVAVGRQVCIAVQNNSDRNLYVTLIDVAASGRVLLLGTGQLPARSRERFWRGNVLGTPFSVSLPDGLPVGVDRLVAIGTTVPGVDLSHLRQDIGFAELLRPPTRGASDRDLDAPAGPPPVEQFTSATADLWVRR